MTRREIDPEAVAKEAIRIVRACSIGQVGDHHFMAEAEAMEAMASLEDPDVRYAVIKTFAATVVGLAMGAAHDRLGQPDAAAKEALAMRYIDTVLDTLRYNARLRPDHTDQ